MLKTIGVMVGLIVLFTLLAYIGLWPSGTQDRALIAATVVAFAMLALNQRRRQGP